MKGVKKNMENQKFRKRDEIIINNILQMSDEKGWTNALLAEKVGTSAQHFNSMKKGRRGVGKQLLTRFAEALNVHEAQLLIDRVEIANERKSGIVPVFTIDEGTKIRSFISGQFLLAAKEKGRMAINTSRAVGEKAFGMKIKDHSMAPRYLPGDIAIIDPENQDETDNAVFAIWMKDEVILRRIRRLETEIRIVADAGNEPDIIIKDSSMLEIVGRVVELYPEI